MRGRTTTRTGWIRRLFSRPFCAALLLAWLGGCAAAPTPQPPPQAGPMDPKRLVAVLVAGDEMPAAFDNATAYMADQLAAAGVPPAQIHRLNTSKRRAPTAEIATESAVVDRIQKLAVPPGGSCLVYL